MRSLAALLKIFRWPACACMRLHAPGFSLSDLLPLSLDIQLCLDPQGHIFWQRARHLTASWSMWDPAGARPQASTMRPERVRTGPFWLYVCKL